MVRRSSRSVTAAQWGTGKTPGGGVKVARSCGAKQGSAAVHGQGCAPGVRQRASQRSEGASIRAKRFTPHRRTPRSRDHQQSTHTTPAQQRPARPQQLASSDSAPRTGGED
eukprot:CAMPEP_0180194640 /NCGR_PEP_ID=MMETSP0987-20121128/3150_1 /TAXON_ID=697907 /ORGANISM="non described non described, Strain CCMP2293" /LENGTH=110 /DNA_ID=CAMNT_0022149405 /DNA_START=768 /DNA_END=1100 /DNA_ORIENTATION=-